MLQMFKELKEYRELLIAFTKRNIKIKYKQTVMGLLWAVFMPSIIVISGILVKIAMAKLTERPVDAAQISIVMVKALPWAFFIGALKFTVGSLVTNANLVKKIYFPRIIFPLSYILGQLFDLAIAGVVLTIILTVVNIGISVHILWVPIFILFLTMFTAGWGMILAAGNLFYRDVRYIVDTILTFAIFFTPVFYEASLFGKWEPALRFFNPVGNMLELFSQVIVFQQAPDFVWVAYAGGCALLSFWGGWVIFSKAEPSFAEII